MPRKKLNGTPSDPLRPTSVNRVEPQSDPQDRTVDFDQRTGTIDSERTAADLLNPDEAKLIVVGIGASAGGFEAITKIFEGLSADTGAAFVIIQHLARDHHTALPELLKGKTAIPMLEPAPGVQLRANHAYVLPPNVIMRLDGLTMAQSKRGSEGGPFLPISEFFHSMAEDSMIRPIAVVLSGSASDGADALAMIKASGGISIAQDPTTARFSAMPSAAIQTGMVDLVLSPEAIAAELNRITGHPYVKVSAKSAANELDITADQYQAIFEILRENSGIDFSQYKHPTIRRRLLRRMVLHKIDDVGAYIDLIRRRATEATDLYNDLLIHVTCFFREPQAFEALRNIVFPTLLDKRRNDDPIRVWVPGCSTGEEAYSVAIELTEFLSERKSDVPFQIFATDVSESAIEKARAGVYGQNIVEEVSPERLRKFFQKSEDRYRIAHAVRDACVFARQDLTRDPPFSKLDLVICRNVLIYLAQPLQRRLLSIFHYGLKRNGYLLLGNSETTAPAGELYFATERQARIYQKKPLDSAPHLSMYNQQMPQRDRPFPVSEARGVPNLQSEVTRLVLERFVPPGVVVDEELQIVQFRGKTGMFLEPAPGDASLNLLKMAKEGLLHGLRIALEEARKSQSPVRKSGLTLRSGQEVHDVNIEVIPLTVVGRPYHLVLFEQAAPSETKGAKRKTAGGPSSGAAERADVSGDAARLQQELDASRDYLQTIIQDLEAANEELQSANEEILSSNEELQSTNEELDTAREELQSTNEELNTLNDELHSRNDELGRVNSDLLNLLASAQLAIVMVSPELRIRRFTPMAEQVLNLISADVGRPISHIKPNIVLPDLEALISKVMEEVITIERDVQDLQGRWWLLRIRPYKDVESRIDGAVLTLVDINAATIQKSELELAADCSAAILDTMNPAMAVLGPNLRVQSVSRAFCEILGYPRHHALGRPIQELSRDWDTSPLVEPLTELMGNHVPARDLELTGNGGAGQSRRLQLRAQRVQGVSTSSPLVLLSIDDRTAHTAGARTANA